MRESTVRTVVIAAVSLAVLIVPLHVAHDHVAIEIADDKQDTHHHHHHGGHHHHHHHDAPEPGDTDNDSEEPGAGHESHDHQLKRETSKSKAGSDLVPVVFEPVTHDLFPSHRSARLPDAPRVTGKRASPDAPRAPPSA